MTNSAHEARVAATALQFASSRSRAHPDEDVYVYCDRTTAPRAMFHVLLASERARGQGDGSGEIVARCRNGRTWMKA